MGREKTGRPVTKGRVDAERGWPLIRAYSIRGYDLAGEFAETTETDNYTAGNEMVILVDATAGAVTVTLPAASTNSSKVYYIKKTDSSGHIVTIKGNAAAETIDGEVEIELTLQYQNIMVICDGTEWFVLGGANVKLEELLNQLLEEQQKATGVLELIERHQQEATDLELKEEGRNERD